MGEIGIPRREFLYDLRFWEVRRIIRGYRLRDRLTHQLLAECAYTTMFAMRDPKGKTAADIFPFIFEEDDDEASHEVSEEEYNELQDIMASINAQHRQNRTKSTEV